MMTAAEAGNHGHVLMMLTDKDREIIAAMAEIGIPRVAGACFLAIQKYGTGHPITQYWLDRTTDLQQPQVCQGVQWLKERGLLAETVEAKSAGKGRPLKIYSLTDASMKTLVQRMISEREKALRNSVETLKILWPGGFA